MADYREVFVGIDADNFQRNWNDRQKHVFLSICRVLIGRLPEHPPPFSACSRSWPWQSRCRSNECRDQSFVSGLQTIVAISLWQTKGGAIVDGCRGAVTGRAVQPTAVGSQNLNDAANDPAIVSSVSAGLVHWKQKGRSSPIAGHQSRILPP